ncbi:hypothetical protein Tco_0565082 [Tanacetum coccineum]
MLAPQVVEGEGLGQSTEPQPAPSTTQPIIEEQISVTESSSPQNTQTHRQALQEDTQLPHTSVPIPNVADEAVFKEWDNRVVRATTTAASLDATQASGNITKTQSMATSNDSLSQEISSSDRPRCQEAMGGVIAQTRSERASKHSYDSPLPRVNTPGSDEERIEHQELMKNIPPTPHDSPLSGGYTPGSDEGRPDLHELMDIYTKLSNRVLDLEKEKDAQAVEILKLKSRIKKLERKAKSSIPPLKRRLYNQVDSSDDRSGGTEVFDDTTAAEKDVNAAEPVSTIGDAVTAASVITDIDTTGPSNVSAAGPSTSTARDIFEDKMMNIADTLVAIRSTRPRTTSVVIRDVEEEPRRATPVPTVQNQDKDQAQFEREQRIARERATKQETKNAALIAEFDNVQARMEADALLAARLQKEEREQFSIDEQARFLVETIAERKREQKWINDFVPMDSEEGGKKVESSKKEAASSKMRQKADPDDENVKRQKIGEAPGSGEEQSAEKEKELSEEELQKLLVIVSMEELVIQHLQVRDDLVKLWDLVKERFSTTEPTNDKEKELWVELKRLFEPDNDDILWKLQRYMHDPLVWRLYDTCGVHHVSSVRGHDIFMLVEKEYPLTRGTLGLMMVARLLVEADSEMSRELLKKIFYQANRPR